MRATDALRSNGDGSDAPGGGAVDVTVVIPIYREEGTIERTLRSLLANEGHEEVEILVVDGMSEDGTRDVVRRVARDAPQVRLIDNPARTVPHAMNLGIQHARGHVLIRVDGHAEVAPDFIARCLEELEAHPECACVGGQIENVDETETAAGISIAMGSPFGVGDARFRLRDYEGYVDTLAFGAYRKQALVNIGGFDEELTRNQDDELNYRLVRDGKRIWLSRGIRSRYYVRGSIPKLWRQYYQYGYWKVYVNRKHRGLTNLRQLVPPAFVAWVAATLLLAPFWLVARWSLAVTIAAYLLAAVAFGLRATRRPRRLVTVIAAFVTMHFGYGLGYLEGVWTFLIRRRKPRPRHAQVSR